MSNVESSIDTRSVVRGENSLVVFMAFIALAHRLRVDGMLLAGREGGKRCLKIQNFLQVKHTDSAVLKSETQLRLSSTKIDHRFRVECRLRGGSMSMVE
jgi:hypothetical protein